MSNKNNEIKSTSQGSNAAVAERKKLDATHIFLIVFAAVALVGILASVIVAIVINVSKKPLDYMEMNISKYVVVPESLYTSYDVTLDVDEVTDLDVQNEIIKVLCTNKIKPDGVVNSLPNITISAGDVAYIYYRGYVPGENDKKDYFSGGCNFDGNIYALEIGSGSFIPGFEYNLIGKNQKDYATMEKITTGFSQIGDIILLEYSAIYADGSNAVEKTAIIDLSDPDLDKKWGEGFSAYFNTVKGKTIGTKFATGAKGDDKLKVGTIKTGEGIADKDTYLDMTVKEVYRISEGDRLEVEAFFPDDYGANKDLAGKKAIFEVYVRTVQDYNVPVIDEKFVTETLKIEADEINSYEGADVAAKYENYVRAQLDEKYHESVDSFIEGKFWEAAIEGATFKKIPEREVESTYREYLADLTASFESGYSSYYNSFDAFARATLGLGSTDDWKAELYSNAEYAIKQKLVFYYIVRVGNIMPTDAQYDEIYNDILDEHILSYLSGKGVAEDAENYDEEWADAKAAVLDYYDDEYWYENVLYDHFVDVILTRANKK